MLHALGAAELLIAQGLKAPTFQYRSKKHGLLAQFDFGGIADVTEHPYRVQCEQSKLTRILYDQMRGHPNFEVHFDSPVVGVTQDASGVEITIDRDGRTERRSGRYLVGADGASSKRRYRSSAVQTSAEECPRQQSLQPPAARMGVRPNPEGPPEPARQ